MPQHPAGVFLGATMTAACIVSALTPKQVKALNEIEKTAKTDYNLAKIMLDNLLFRTFNASARHSIRAIAQTFLM
jgi:hypothetical protein